MNVGPWHLWHVSFFLSVNYATACWEVTGGHCLSSKIQIQSAVNLVHSLWLRCCFTKMVTIITCFRSERKWQGLTHSPFTPDINVCLLWSNHKWIALREGVNGVQSIFKTHCDSIIQATFEDGQGCLRLHYVCNMKSKVSCCVPSSNRDESWSDMAALALCPVLPSSFLSLVWLAMPSPGMWLSLVSQRIPPSVHMNG